jgi:hypothetical protein
MTSVVSESNILRASYSRSCLWNYTGVMFVTALNQECILEGLMCTSRASFSVRIGLLTFRFSHSTHAAIRCTWPFSTAIRQRVLPGRLVTVSLSNSRGALRDVDEHAP